MRKSHGETQLIDGKRVASPEYRSWQMMKNRVLNPKCKDYAYYQRQGVTITDKWLTFEGFLADMGRRPTPEHTLDRIDTNGPYCKENCRWATRQEQSRNRGAYHTVDLQLADKIRALYATGQYSQSDLANHFGLWQADISQITRNVRWARAGGP